MLAYLLIGTIAGLISFAIALFLGASFGLALGLYSFVGAVVLFVVPLAQTVLSALVVQTSRVATRVLTDRRTGLVPTDVRTGLSSLETELSTAPTRILAVDDDPFILELIPMICSRAGFSEVTPAASGELAIEALANVDVVFDCLLLDISMPGMDGIELCRRVREMPDYRDTPIIMLTAMRDIKSMDKALQAGATDYITKPFDVIELGARLKLVQEARGATNSSESSQPQAAATAHREHLDPSDLRRLAGPRSLVDQKALSSHLSLLSPIEAANTQVLAVKIDRADAILTRVKWARYISILNDVAAALDGRFGANRLVMAYAGGGTFLLATDRCKLRPSEELESDINGLLCGNSSNSCSTEPGALTVSVGKPVQPRGTKEQRSESSFVRAIALVNSRALDKQGEPKSAVSSLGRTGSDPGDSLFALVNS